MADEIEDAAWYRENRVRLTAAYLSGDSPRAQSGHSGDQDHWTQARSLIADGLIVPGLSWISDVLMGSC
jgi:hypothetical protein